MINHLSRDNVEEVIVLSENYFQSRQSSNITKDSKDYKNLKAFLENLSKEQVCELVAVMWIGRGENGAVNRSAWDYHYTNAKARHDAGTVRYVMEKTPLTKYLTQGMTYIGI